MFFCVLTFFVKVFLIWNLGWKHFSSKKNHGNHQLFLLRTFEFWGFLISISSWSFENTFHKNKILFTKTKYFSQNQNTFGCKYVLHLLLKITFWCYKAKPKFQTVIHRCTVVETPGPWGFLTKSFEVATWVPIFCLLHIPSLMVIVRGYTRCQPLALF